MPTLQEVTDQLYGERTFVPFDDDTVLKVDVIPTGIEVLDQALGVGGVPIGRITEIYGQNSSGKTTICLNMIASANRLGMKCCYIDAEHALDMGWAKTNGVDLSMNLLAQPQSGNEALELVEAAIVSEGYKLIIIDSVAALTPTEEFDKDMGELGIGLLARLMAQGMRKLVPQIGKHKVAVVFINQTRTNIGVGFNKITTPGGNALKFASSVRIEVKYVGQIKDPAGNKIAGKHRAKIIKNKVAMPFKECEFEINSNGVDESSVIVTQLLKAGVLTKAGAWIKFNDESLAQGTRAMGIKLKQNPELKKKLVSLL